MIPVIIQKRGAVHLADQDESAAADILLEPPATPPTSNILRHVRDRSVLELVPESVARANLVFPLRLEGETLVVAAADPNNILVRDQLTFILNKKIRLVPLPRDEIIAAINEHYGQTETESVSSLLCEFTDTAYDL